MITKYGRPYMEGALYQDLKAKTQQLIDPREGDVWLDAGCGQLAMTELIWRKSGGKVKGIWAADIFLAGARAKLGQFNDAPAIKLIYADLQQQMAFPDNFFDGIVGNHVLTFLLEFEGRRGNEALEGVLQEMFRLLKPGGHLVWSIPRENVSNVAGMLLLLKHILNPLRWLRYRVPVPVAALKIFKFTRQIEKKGEQGTYLLLAKEECERILASVGFVDPEWRTAFAHQCWVNRVYKPDVASSRPSTVV
jgi:ubiquinone/menaquinone biosynthesis C-methylase UbiE